MMRFAQAKYLKVFDDGVFQNGKTLGIRRNRNGRELLVGADRGESEFSGKCLERKARETDERSGAGDDKKLAAGDLHGIFQNITS